MGNFANIIRFGWPYLQRYWRRLAAGIFLGILFGLINASFVWAVQTLFARLDPNPAPLPVAPAQSGAMLDIFRGWHSSVNGWINPWLPLAGRALDWRQVVGGLCFFPLLAALRGYIGFLSSYCLAWVSERVINDLRVAVLRKMTTLSLDFFNRSTMGDLVTRVNGDTAALHRCLSLGVSDLVKEPVTIVSIVVALCFINPKMTLFTLIFLPLCVVPMVILGRKIRRMATAGVQVGITQSSMLMEALANIRVVKAFGLEGRQIENFRGLSQKLVHYGVKGVQAKELINPIVETISMIGLGALIVFIFYSGTDLPQTVGFLTGVVLLFQPVKKLSALYALFQQTRVGVDRLTAMFREQPTVRDSAAPAPMKAFQDKIVFQDVTFAYTTQPVLLNLNIEIPRGTKLGIAGESGSGKSTLINLLLRFHDPTSGQILFDGQDLRSLAQADLRGQIALVSQEVVLFDLTVAENIACGRPEAGSVEIEAAARAAYAHDFIMQLPQGYATRIGERGVTLSGGQRQRLAIARAFIRNAPILILDEATAALDSQSESEVQRALDHLAENRTVICVAHRLSTLAVMDHILVFSQG
ncbi:MAG: ABC transporter ATP-binding protein, partial [Pedosphaera sp.]|nr:ABC transporter ATP-binding protein [Pedosphaera sp.]